MTCTDSTLSADAPDWQHYPDGTELPCSCQSGFHQGE